MAKNNSKTQKKSKKRKTREYRPEQRSNTGRIEETMFTWSRTSQYPASRANGNGAAVAQPVRGSVRPPTRQAHMESFENHETLKASSRLIGKFKPEPRVFSSERAHSHRERTRERKRHHKRERESAGKVFFCSLVFFSLSLLFSCPISSISWRE